MLLDAMASDDADHRVLVHPLAVAATRYTKAKFPGWWKTASSDERGKLLEEWRTFWSQKSAAPAK